MSHWQIEAFSKKGFIAAYQLLIWEIFYLNAFHPPKQDGISNSGEVGSAADINHHTLYLSVPCLFDGDLAGNLGSINCLQGFQVARVGTATTAGIAGGTAPPAT